MDDPIAGCPHCRCTEMTMFTEAPNFDDCEYLCLNCDRITPGISLELIDTLNDDDSDEWDIED